MTDIQARALCKSAGITAKVVSRHIGRTLVEIQAHAAPAKHKHVLEILKEVAPSGTCIKKVECGRGDNGSNILITLTKSAAKKKTVAKKSAVKRAAPRKPAVKKAVKKKTTTRKPATKKTTRRKASK